MIAKSDSGNELLASEVFSELREVKKNMKPMTTVSLPFVVEELNRTCVQSHHVFVASKKEQRV